MRDRSPQALWETVLGQLELQVTRPNFETWLRNTAGLAQEAGTLTVGVPSDFCMEWLRTRMNAVIDRTVSQVAGHQITVTFQVLGAPVPVASPANGHTSGPQPRPQPELDPRLTFESFVPAGCNRLAHQAARKIAAGQATFNPLVLVGNHGLGKTHLLHAIGHHAAEHSQQVIALTAEAFVDRFGKAVRSGQPHTFREPFKDCTIFLLDDLSFLASRTASQEQFLHLFDTLQSTGCRIVVASDARPDNIKGLSARLRSRLLAGLVVELHPPQRDDRMYILSARLLTTPTLSPAIVNLIADQPSTSIRDLEGAANRITAFAELSSVPLTLEAARQALHPFHTPAQITPNDIVRVVCTHFGITIDQLSSASRARDIAYARHIAMYLLRQHTNRPLAEIGRLIGGRDHSTALHAYRRIHKELATLPQTQADLAQLEAALTSDSASSAA